MKTKKKPSFQRNDAESQVKKKKGKPKEKYRHFTRWLEEDNDDMDESFDFYKQGDA